MSSRSAGVTSEHRGAPKRLAGLAAVFLVIPTVAAGQQPVVSEIEVVPSVVVVDAVGTDPTSFVLEARLWTGLPGDRSGILEFDGVKPTWQLISSPAGVHLSSTAGGYHATVLLDPGINLTGPFTVKALAGGIGAVSQIMPASASGDDGIEASYRDGSAPDAMAVHGIRTPADLPCAVWLAPALVRRGRAGQVNDECGGSDPPWGIALLSVGHALEMYQPKWSSGVEQTDASSPAAIRTIPLAVRILIGGVSAGLATRQSDAVTYANVEITDANTVLAESRAGVELGTPHLDIVTVPAPGGETYVRTCAEGDFVTSGYDYVPPKAPTSTPPMLHIYLVDRMGNQNGFTCAPTKARPFPVIYLQAAATSGTFLLHELGHALGLANPGQGHSDRMKGFDPANVMASGYADTDDVWRRRFTVGQVVRMNTDLGSWLNWSNDETGTRLREMAAPRLACQCGYEDPPGGLCPRWVDDVARERGGLRNRLHEWDCADQIQLPAPELAAGEEPVALIAGRRWGTEAADCRRDIPGDWKNHDQADFINFANVTRSTGCPSWIAIFFRHQAPIFRDLTTMSGSWNDAAELRVLDRAPTGPRSVIVHVHYKQADDTRVTNGIAQTVQIYGEANRAGLAFTFVRHKTLPNTCPPDVPLEFHICWSSAAGVPLPQRVGEKLGLSILAGPQLGDRAFELNAMRPAPTTGAALTLGQLFRIHGTLVPTDFPNCTNTTGICPPLEADIKP